VGVENEAGDTHEWRIVGPDEFDLTAAKISCDSPLGRGLLGKEIDAEIELETPSGVTRWTLVSIRYGAD
jgi:transcription elongation factor GreB